MPRAEAAVPLLEVVGESVEVAEAPTGAASSHADAPALLEPEQPERGGGDDLLGRIGRIRSVTGASAAIGTAALALANGDLGGGVSERTLPCMRSVWCVFGF